MLDFGYYNMDCMQGMKEFPDNYFDLAIVDPPYGINAAKMTMGSGKHQFSKNKDWDAGIPDEAYFQELFRVSKNQIIWGGELLYRAPSTVTTLDCMGQNESKFVLCGGRACLGAKRRQFAHIQILYGAGHEGRPEDTSDTKAGATLQVVAGSLRKARRQDTRYTRRLGIVPDSLRGLRLSIRRLRDRRRILQARF